MISFTRKQNIKYLGAIILITIITLGAGKLYTDYGHKKIKGQGKFTEIAPKDLYDSLKSSSEKQKIAVIDLRTPGEYNEEHLSFAKWINYFDEDYKAKLITLDKSKAYYIIDKAGRTTTKIAKKMKEWGFTEVHRVRGGLREWKAENLPLNLN